MATETSTDALQIDIQHMPHEAYIRRCGEDWAGITNRKERKRLQNRLNQRAREYPLFITADESNRSTEQNERSATEDGAPG